MNSHAVLRALALSLIMATCPAFAQPSQPPTPSQQGAPPSGPAGADADADATELIGEMQQIQQRLMAVQERALETDTQLQAQAQGYQQTLLAAMQADGFDAMQSLKHIEAIEQQIQSETLNEHERASLLAEVREQEQLLLEAEEAALRREDVQQVREQLMQGLLTAMRRLEPQTDELIQQLEAKNTQLRTIISAEAPQAR